MKNIHLTDEEVARLIAEADRDDSDDQIEPRAVKAWFEAERNLVMFEMRNGCVFGFPPPKGPYYGLDGASPEKLAKVKPIPPGDGIEWDELDVQISVPGIMFHLLNVRGWYAKWLGGAKSEAKAAAARENGKKGGRPRKKTAAPKRASRRKTAQAGD